MALEKQLYRNIEDSMSRNDWDSACYNSVSCTIAANDAVIVKFSGLLSVDTDHRNAAKLLIETFLKIGIKKEGVKILCLALKATSFRSLVVH